MGSGRRLVDPEKFIGLKNRTKWEPLLAQLHDCFDTVVLWACDVGAGPDGAALLSLLANVLHARVKGPTGVLNCEGEAGFSLLDGAQWQAAEPNQEAPPSIAAPAAHQEARKARSVEEQKADIFSAPPPEDAFDLIEADGTTHIAWNNIDSIGYRTSEPGARPLAKFGIQVESLDALVDFDDPLTMSGPLLAVQTGTLTVSFTRFNVAGTRTFQVFNDRFLHNVRAAPNIYYRAVSGLSKQL